MIKRSRGFLAVCGEFILYGAVVGTERNSMHLRASAKINLSFRILGRREDGFHEIETLMAPISLFDEISILRGGEHGAIEFSCDDPSLPTRDDNLASRAARLFRQATGVTAGISIHLKKSIPHGAGLAGGSSDAASVLLGLNRLFETNLSQAQLSELAAEIGSDVPFFLCETPALCRGRGELVGPAPRLDPLPLLLLKPSFGVPTPWAYTRWKDSKEWRGIDYGPQNFADTAFINHLERPVFEKFIFLAELKQWLRAQAEVAVALMSGSGSTVFAVLHRAGNAESLAIRARSELDPELWSCACETLNSSPNE